MSIDDSDCDFSTLVQEIRDALDMPYVIVKDPNNPELSQDTKVSNTCKDEFNAIYEQNSKRILFMNAKDKEMIEEQIRILQQIKWSKSSSKINDDQKNSPDIDKDIKQVILNQTADDKVDPVLKQDSLPYTIVDVNKHVSTSATSSSLADSDSSISTISDDYHPNYYSKLLQNIKEAVYTSTPMFVNPAPTLVETNITQSPRTDDDDCRRFLTKDDIVLIMNDKDKLFIEEQYQIQKSSSFMLERQNSIRNEIIRMMETDRYDTARGKVVSKN